MGVAKHTFQSWFRYIIPCNNTLNKVDKNGSLGNGKMMIPNDRRNTAVQSNMYLEILF